MLGTKSSRVEGAPPVAVTAFVDWRAQTHNAGVPRANNAEAARRTLTHTARMVGRALTQEHLRFRVSFRLYHGWHRGWQPTGGLRAATQAVGAANFAALSGERIEFSPKVQYGHTLLTALPERQHPRRSLHLPNTLRDQGRGQPRTEKMVDTALAADLLAWARLFPSEWALVLAEDDDVVPPLFTAEAWVKPHGGRTLLVRRRPAGQFLRLDGLLKAVARATPARKS